MFYWPESAIMIERYKWHSRSRYREYGLFVCARVCCRKAENLLDVAHTQNLSGPIKSLELVAAAILDDGGKVHPSTLITSTLERRWIKYLVVWNNVWLGTAHTLERRTESSMDKWTKLTHAHTHKHSRTEICLSCTLTSCDTIFMAT